MDRSGKNKADFLEKPPFNAIEKTMSTAFGQMLVKGPLDPEYVYSCRLSEGLCCFRPHHKQHRALVELSAQPDGLVFACLLTDNIVSYVTFQKPDYPWWKKRCFPELLELGSIETDLDWRKKGLAHTLFTNIFKNPAFNYFDDYVIMAVQVIHSWDLKNTNLSEWAYRQFMMDFFKKYGFTIFDTVDPEVSEHPCNNLMVRIGKNLCPDIISHFTECCLGTN